LLGSAAAESRSEDQRRSAWHGAQRGDVCGTEHNGEMYADYLVATTTAGQVVWEWWTWEHLDPERDCITAVQDPREEWTHGNGVAELPNGDIALSFRNISTVIIIDRKT